MRSMVVALLAGSAVVGAASAQAPAPPEGPLAAGNAAGGIAGPVEAAPKHRKKSRHHAAKPAGETQAARARDTAAPAMPSDGAGAGNAPPPTSQARRAAPVDPLDFSFKWRGSNDTAEQTRVQNYNGDAAGTGAAVGLKLHF